MIEKIKVELNRCTCSCGHSWLSEEVPKRCAGCRSRNWNSDDRPQPPRSSPPLCEAEPELDPFAEVSQIEKPEKPKSTGSKIAEDLLARMASKLGRPAHAPNCTCFVCKPPKDK